MGTAVIFGGTGFIGTHLAQDLLAQDRHAAIVLVDIRPPRDAGYARCLQEGLRSGRIQYVAHDVRAPLPEDLCAGPIDTIYNLAAIHREPGHEPREYFETNLPGAEAVCAWAARRGCRRMVFTSSISPYGPSEDAKNEFSVPVPETAYGSSKLAAEKIHLGWQGADAERKLLIVRPGVVFGPGEQGNVTRLLRSLVRGYFVYMGNRTTRKAAGYVKELCSVLQFGLETLEREDRRSLLMNFTLDPAPTLEEFVTAIQTVAGIRRPIPAVPRRVLLAASYPVSGVADMLGIRQPVNPMRVRKLFRSTNIEPAVLRELGYNYRYTLESAFQDWKQDAPEDFARETVSGSAPRRG